MNIAYVVPSLANRGPVIVVNELVNQFVKNGHSCIVFYMDELSPTLPFNCHVQRIGKKEKVDFIRFDIVHSHGMRPDAYVGENREYSGRVRYISTIHNYVLSDFTYQYNWLIAQIFGRKWMRTLRHHDKIVALSADAERYYSRWFSSDKLTYAYNTRNPDRTKKLTRAELVELEQFKTGSVLIGVNVLLTARKGIDVLIDNLGDLPNHKLFIVGDGGERKALEKLARRRGVADRCYFAGYRADAYRYVIHYDIYAMPSRSEGFPLSLLEVAFFGVRAVCSDLPVFKETFSDDEVAFFESAKPKSIVQTIEHASADKMMGERMRKKYKDAYAPAIMYKRYLSIYNGEI